MKTYEIAIISNMGKHYYETVKCEDINEFFINGMALHQSFYKFNNHQYFLAHIFRLTVNEVTTIEYDTTEGSVEDFLKDLFEKEK